MFEGDPSVDEHGITTGSDDNASARFSQPGCDHCGPGDSDDGQGSGQATGAEADRVESAGAGPVIFRSAPMTHSVSQHGARDSR